MREAAAARPAAAVCVLIGALGAASCGRAPGGEISPVYDRKSGKLTELVYDSDRDGRADTWSYMDGPRIVRIELDTNDDGAVDRWEYYDSRGSLEKVGMSRAGDTTVDAWMYPNPDGSVGRVELATRRDGRITRREYYVDGQLDRAEEDVDADGRPDKWERYRGDTLSTVAYDTTRQGRADRTFVYNADGTLHHIEDGSGRVVADEMDRTAPSAAPGSPARQ
jgi:hypothetical protein